jgi:hypothetical protein
MFIAHPGFFSFFFLVQMPGNYVNVCFACGVQFVSKRMLQYLVRTGYNQLQVIHELKSFNEMSCQSFEILNKD